MEWLDRDTALLSTGKRLPIQQGAIGFIRRRGHIFLTQGADTLLNDFVNLTADEKLELLDHGIFELEEIKMAAVRELRQELDDTPPPSRPGKVHNLVVRMKEAAEIKKRHGG